MHRVLLVYALLFCLKNCFSGTLLQTLGTVEKPEMQKTTVAEASGIRLKYYGKKNLLMISY